MNVSNINELNLNDSGLMGIAICSGEVIFRINYIEDYDSDLAREHLLVFKGCRSFSSCVNLNVVWPDSILRGCETVDGEWRNVILEMNTSASVYKISCHSVELCSA